MKKCFSIVVCLLVLCCSGKCFAFDIENASDNIYICYSSASSLKYKMNSLNRTIKSNEYKIRSIKLSKNLSSYEKNRSISKLESQNRNLKRQINKIKYEYSRAIS